MDKLDLSKAVRDVLAWDDAGRPYVFRDDHPMEKLRAIAAALPVEEQGPRPVDVALRDFLAFGHPREGSAKYHAAWENLAALASLPQEEGKAVDRG